MKIKIFKILFLMCLFIPVISHADFKGLVQCDGINTVCNFDTAVATFEKIVDWILGISVSVAAISFAYAGGEMLIFPTDPGKRKDAKEVFEKTVIGLLVILSSWLVVTTIVKALVGNSDSALRFLIK